MTDWRPTPKSRLIKARRYDPASGRWETCEYKDLKKGDIFKSFTSDGPLHPTEQEPCDDDVVSLCLDDPAKVTGEEGDGRNEGYGVEIVCGTLGDIMKAVAN